MARMTLIYNHKMMEARRRELRARMTKSEKVFWYAVRNEQILGTKFRRQFSVDAYVVDFYAAIPRLAVEIDGEYHLDLEQQEYDKVRQMNIQNHGITFLRFTNQQVLTDLDLVLRELQVTLVRLLAQRHPSP